MNTQEERINKATALIAAAEKRLAEAQARLEALRTPPKPKLIGVPLREAPEAGAKYWHLNSRNKVERAIRGRSTFDSELLAAGNVFSTREDAEFVAKKRAIFAHPIGEWEPEKLFYMINTDSVVQKSCDSGAENPDTYRLWLNGELAFGDDGKAELERRATAWQELCKEYRVGEGAGSL